MARQSPARARGGAHRHLWNPEDLDSNPIICINQLCGLEVVSHPL